MKREVSQKRKRKKLDATHTILLSFFLVIFTGACLLSLPISNQGESAGFLNNLFVATSATCVTGLTPLVVADQYSIFGQIVLIGLMQIGGLGFMTLVALFVITTGHKLRLADRGLMLESLNLNSAQGVGKIVKKIVKYVFVIEGIGFLIYTTQFVPEFGLARGLFTSLFIAVSAFCNAGFDNIGATNLQPYALNPVISFTTTSLIILGGIGYMVWFDVGTKIMAVIKKELPVSRMFKALCLHTKLVLMMTAILLFGGMLIIFGLEYHNMQTIGSYSLGQKLMVSFFQSTTLRTAGFSTINFGVIKPATQMIMLLIMFIGGSPGGTAGGVKTTTFAIIVIAVWTQVVGLQHPVAMKKQIERDAIIRAITIVAISLTLLFTIIFICLIFEPFSFMELAFESVSALATVGLSLNITPLLSPVGKIAMIVLMYSGRVGVMSIGVSLSKKQNLIKNDIAYPHENVLIG